MNQQGGGKATRTQIASLWIVACSLALTLLRTIFDVPEDMGR
jgi:hypothetical protein